jgi:hypothetical protein
MVLATTPHVAQVGHDFLREQRSVLSGALFIQIAELAEHHQMADVEHLDGLLQAFAHGCRAASNHIALFDEVLPLEVLADPLRFFIDLRSDAGANGLDRPIARGLGVARIDL